MVGVTDIAAHGQAEQLAAEMVLQAGAGDLFGVKQILGPDKADHRVDQQGFEVARHRVGAGLAGLLVHPVVRVGRECAALAGFKVHHVVAHRPAPQRQCRAARLGQQSQVDAKAAVGGLGTANGLEHQIHRGAQLHRTQGVGDMGQHAGLRGDVVAADHCVQHGHDLHHLRHVVGCRVDADHRVPTAIQEAVEHAGGDAGGVVGWVVGLQACGHAPGQADGVAKSRDRAAFFSHQNQILVAHDLAHRCGHFGCDAGGHSGQRGTVGRIAQKPVAKVTHRQMPQRREGRNIMRIDD